MQDQDSMSVEDISQSELKNYVEFAEGDFVMTQGQYGDTAYIIEEGEVKIYVNRPNGVSLDIGTRGPGAIIGEMAIIDGSQRTATIKALTHCKMVEITRESFENLLESSDPIIRMVIHVILTRYRDALKRTKLMRDPYEGNVSIEDVEKRGDGNISGTLKKPDGDE